MLKIALKSAIVKRSFMVALVVVTVLNLINQGDLITDGKHIDLVKCVLTYIVPYCVATYGAVCALVDSQQGEI